MKYWTYEHPGDGDEPVTITLSEKEILEDYWDRWCEHMRLAGMDLSIYTRQDCIDDWVTIHWARESTP